jgi:hypothetical protein
MAWTPTPCVAPCRAPSPIRSKTPCPSSNPSYSSEPNLQSIVPTLPLALTLVMMSLAACWIASASRAACRPSRPFSTDARILTLLDLCSSMLPATLPRHPLPAWNPRGATATRGTTAALISRMMSTTTTVGRCQLRDSNPSFLLVPPQQRRLGTLRLVTIRGAPWTAAALVLLILHLDTRLLLGLLVK